MKDFLYIFIIFDKPYKYFLNLKICNNVNKILLYLQNNLF